MNDTAKTLNELIDIYGFGCEFSPEELYNHFDNPQEVMESLKEHGLIEKNQISDKYYLSDIFTCIRYQTSIISQTYSHAAVFSHSISKRTRPKRRNAPKSSNIHIPLKKRI